MNIPDFTELPGLSEFLQSAARGRHNPTTASTGEASAHALAKKIRSLSGLLMDMDRQRQEGFLSALLVAADPDTRSSILARLG